MRRRPQGAVWLAPALFGALAAIAIGSSMAVAAAGAAGASIPSAPGSSAASVPHGNAGVPPPQGAPAADRASPVPPTAQTTGASGPMTPGPDVPLAATPPIEAPAPRAVVTADVAPAESDHDAVVGAWGIEVRPVATTLPVFNRRPSTGCPLTAATPATTGATTGSTAPFAPADCPPVSVAMFSVRHWVNRNLAWTVGAALAAGGGSQSGRLLDTYLGFGPGVGVSLLLGNWRHLAVAASPSLALVWFRGAGSVATTYVADLRADLEGELHFGFVGVPALSLSVRSGVLLRLEKAADLTEWSAGVVGATSLRGLVSDLSLRYYF